MVRLSLIIAAILVMPNAPRACAASTGLKSELGVLLRLKVISSDAYWLEHAVPGASCDGQRVRDLLLRMANAVDPVQGGAQPLATLLRRNIIWNDYWEKNALPGKPCNGEYVGTLIHAAADVLADVELVRSHHLARGVIPLPAASAFSLASATDPVGTFDTILGTQTFSPAYRFTKQSRLVETAEAIRRMGSSVIKFGLSATYARGAGNVDAYLPNIHSLTDLVRDEPSHRRVLDMPFSHYVLWTHTFSVGESRWRDGFSRAEKEAEYREIYDLARYLLLTYSGSSKTFYLGHWEGDGLLRGTVAPENDARVTATAVQGMADWLNTRQRAVDDAKRDTPHRAVEVWNYTEVNHVKLAMLGRPALVNEVLPKTNVDLVSYSCYDTEAQPELLKCALSYIESKLPAKPGFKGRRVFIGEYGFPAERYSPDEQDRLSRGVMRAGIEWGCPLILYWELYNNEVGLGGKQRGFWLIDDKGSRQPVYETHRAYFEWARRFLREYRSRTGKIPANDMFRRSAASTLARIRSDNLDTP